MEISGPEGRTQARPALDGVPAQPPSHTSRTALFTPPQGEMMNGGGDMGGMAGNPIVGTMSAMQSIEKDVQRLVAANPGMPDLQVQLAPYVQAIREVVVQLLSSQAGGAPGAAPQIPGLPPALPPGTGFSEGQQMGTGMA